ncbi:MAG: DUF6263 family protein [Weeksellaceae bacterium]
MKFKFILPLFALLIICCSKMPEQTPVDNLSIENIKEDGGDKVLIRVKPKVGDAQKMLMTMNVNMDEQNMNMNMTSGLDMKVVDRTDSVYTYEIKYNSINMSMKLDGLEISFDSEHQDKDGMGYLIYEQLQPVLNEPTIMTMNDFGEISQVQLPGSLKMEQAGDLNSILLPLPKEAVGVGDTWTSLRELGNDSQMEMNMQVKKITVDDVYISTTGDIRDNNKGKIGEFDGEYRLDRKTGFTRDGTMNLNYTDDGQNMMMKINFKSL